jgi:Zn-finger nucleic acid-binding protein
MTETSSDLPICIHCGTPRPADETVCPNCSKPWIDVSVKDAAAAGTVAAAAAATSKRTPEPATDAAPPPPALDDTGEFSFDDWTLPPERKPSKAKWFIPLALVAAVAALWVFVFADSDSSSTDQSVVAADTTTTVAPTTTRIETTTTSPDTTTTTSTTTTIVYPSADSWPAVGEPIPTTELGLKASGIGPISIGTPITDAAGSLVASLGPADGAGIDSDLCPGSEWYWLDWGDLRGLFDGYEDDSLFIAYRYETDGESEPEPTLETLSGIRLGDTVEMLQNTYTSYTVSFEVLEGRDYFRLADGGDLLLWGPVTSTEPLGIIQGIYSPDPCQT